MWFLNKKTGVKWEIIDKNLIERLSKDDNYKEVKETKKSTAKKSTKKKSK